MARFPLCEMSWPPWVLHFSLQPLEFILRGWSHRNCIFDINSLADSSSPTMSRSYLKLIAKYVASLQFITASSFKVPHDNQRISILGIKYVISYDPAG